MCYTNILFTSNTLQRWIDLSTKRIRTRIVVTCTTVVCSCSDAGAARDKKLHLVFMTGNPLNNQIKSNLFAQTNISHIHMGSKISL